MNKICRSLRKCEIRYIINIRTKELEFIFHIRTLEYSKQSICFYLYFVFAISICIINFFNVIQFPLIIYILLIRTYRP